MHLIDILTSTHESLENYVGNYTKKIDLTNYSKGAYLLKIKTGTSYFNKKLILN